MGSRASVSVGSLLAGRYRLVEPLPDAAVGTWRARDDISDRDVAARKLPLGPGEVQEAVRQRAVHQVRDAARLRHAGIVAVYDVVEHDGVPWVVMELVRAPTLEHVLRTRGPVPPVEAALIGLRVLEALEVADAAGVRHGDLTPACILVGGDGRVAVAGFGLTPEVEPRSPDRPAGVTGSVDFVAPERARGIPTSGIEADLWSLGAILYAVVEGRMPFHRDAALATLTAVVTDEPPPPRRAGALRPVIDGLLIKDSAHRLGLADARRMLDGVLRGIPVVPARRWTSGGAGSRPENGAVPRSAGPETAGGPAVAGAVGSAPPAGPMGGDQTRAGAARTAGDGPAADRTGADEPVGAGTAAGGAGAATARPAPGTVAAGTTRTDNAGTSGAGTDAAADGAPGAGIPAASTAGADPDGAGPEGAARDGMTGARAAGGSGGTPAKGAPEEPGSATPDDDGEIHDPEVAAALAAFEAALGPMISKPRSPVVAGPDVPASPAAAAHDASASPAAGPDVPASPAARPDVPASPAAGPDVPTSPAAGQDHAPAAPVTAGHDAPARPATGPDTPASPATGPDAPARPDLPAPEAAGRRAADDAPPRPLAASKPPTRPKPVPRTTFPAPPVRRPVNGRSAAALPGGPSVIGTAPSADLTPRNGRTPPLTRPAAPARPRPTPFPTPPRPRIEDLAGGGSDSRRRSALTVLAIALALVAAVLIPFAVDRVRDASGSPPQAGLTSASPTDPASSSPSPEAAAPPPAGFRLHRDRTGFSIAIPRGWREERDGSIVDFRDPTSSRFIRIDQRADPRTDPYDDWIGLEPTYKRRLPGYDLLGIANVPYRGWRAADWEFTWGAPGSERSHVRIRNVVPNQYHGYALYWSTTDSEWTKDLPYFDIFVRTFAPRAGR